MKDLFPSLFPLAVNKDALVDDYCEHVSESYVSSSIFFRDAFVYGITLVSFLSMPVHQTRPDRRPITNLKTKDRTGPKSFQTGSGPGRTRIGLLWIESQIEMK